MPPLPSRSVSTAFRTAIEKRRSEEPIIELFRITVAGRREAIRVANNTEDIVSNGETFQGFPFSLSLPDDSEDGQSLGRIRIQNVDRDIGEAVESLENPPSIDLMVVMAGEPDDVEIAINDLALRNVNGDAMEVTGDIGIRHDIATLSFPAIRATQSRCPGLWR